MSEDLDSIVDKLVEAQYSKESPVQIANAKERIAVLEATLRNTRERLKFFGKSTHEIDEVLALKESE